MDIAIHWGVLRHLRDDVNAKAWVLVSAISLDAAALVAFLLIKGAADPMIVVIAVAAIAAIFLFERFYLARQRSAKPAQKTAAHEH